MRWPRQGEVKKIFQGYKPVNIRLEIQFWGMWPYVHSLNHSAIILEAHSQIYAHVAFILYCFTILNSSDLWNILIIL